MHDEMQHFSKAGGEADGEDGGQVYDRDFEGMLHDRMRKRLVPVL